MDRVESKVGIVNKAGDTVWSKKTLCFARIFLDSKTLPCLSESIVSEVGALYLFSFMLE